MDESATAWTIAPNNRGASCQLSTVFDTIVIAL
jgi:hypothetical protein